MQKWEIYAKLNSKNKNKNLKIFWINLKIIIHHFRIELELFKLFNSKLKL
jgi:hypothetical protein